MSELKGKENPLILIAAFSRRGRELFQQLVSLGFNVRDVSPEVLFDAFLEGSPDLVLVEFSNDKRGVEDLAHRIRGTDYGLAVPVYFFGEGDGPNAVEVVSLGGDLYFSVPVSEEFLFEKLGFMNRQVKSKDSQGSTGTPLSGGDSGDSGEESGEGDGGKEERKAREKKGDESRREVGEDIGGARKERRAKESIADPISRALEMAELLSDPGLSDEPKKRISWPVARDESDGKTSWPVARDESDGKTSRPVARDEFEGVDDGEVDAQGKVSDAQEVMGHEREALEDAGDVTAHEDLPDLQLPDDLEEPKDDDDSFLFEDLDGKTPHELPEPGIVDSSDGGVVPSLKAMLPDDDDLAGADKAFDLDLLDIDSTMPGVDGTGLSYLADPDAGMAGLDVPDSTPHLTGEKWSEHDTDSTDSRMDSAFSEGEEWEKGDNGEEEEWVEGYLRKEKRDIAEKRSWEARGEKKEEAGVERGSETEEEVGDITLDPGPLSRDLDGRVLGKSAVYGKSTEVLEEGRSDRGEDTVVGHKKKGARKAQKSAFEPQEIPRQTPKKDLKEVPGETPKKDLKEVSREEGVWGDDPIDLIARLYRSSVTGRLCLKTGKGEVFVFFVQGSPRFLHTEDASLDLIAGLERQARISRGQMERVRHEMEENGLKAEVALVKLGYVAEVEVPFLMRSHMETLFYEIVGCRKGEYLYEPSVLVDDLKVYRIARPFSALLLEALRRKDKGEAAVERLGGGDSSLSKWNREGIGSFLEEADLTGKEGHAIDYLSGGIRGDSRTMSLRQVAESMGAELSLVAIPAYAAVLLGIAEVAEEDERVDEDVSSSDQKESVKSDKPEDSVVPVGGARVYRQVSPEVHEERISAKLEDVKTRNYFEILGVSQRAGAYEVKSSYEAMVRNFSKDVIPEELMEKRGEDLETIKSALKKAADVLSHPRYGPLYKRALERASEETD